MKANEAENNKRKAPDKIYACFGVFGLIQATEIRATSKDIEYIRKDVLIEKACEYLMEYEFNDSPTIADRRKRVDKFIKYMKRE